MIGIDVGGANLKVVDNDEQVHLHYCPLWEGAAITGLLKPYARTADEPAAVVMSGELADCFLNKMQGISFIVSAVREAFPRARFYGTDAAFHTGPVPELAAANWLASADLLSARYPDAVLLDVGSTTADIIPLTRLPTLRVSPISPASRPGILCTRVCSAPMSLPWCDRSISTGLIRP
jgi:probable H4MPT-linked C1 transfer pathway protein